MTLYRGEGFGFSTAIADYTSMGRLSATSGSVTIGSGGAFGGNYASIPAAGSLTMAAGATLQTSYIGCRVRLPSSSAARFALWNNTPNLQLTATFDPASGVITAARGGLTTVATSPAGLFAQNNWFYYEQFTTIDNGTSGAVTMRVNGSTVLTVTGINTANDTLNKTISSLIWGAAATGAIDIADIYVGSSAFLGDVRVAPVLPSSNGHADFTPTGSTNWANAAHVPPSPGSNYNSSSTPTNFDNFLLAVPPTGLGTVYGVQVSVCANKSDAGARGLKATILSNATTSQSGEFALSASAAEYLAMFETDPNTGAAWTNAAVAAARPGYLLSS